ncbi:hypothetical protein FHG87_021858 [Trinorchestia longiramus]|nr:hypothetical protein FHG87_021858 [Trinorchestia longiramus]
MSAAGFEPGSFRSQAGEENGVKKWKHSLNGKTTLIWCASKNVPRFEMFYGGSFGSQLCLPSWRWNEEYKVMSAV